jgi:hypothetical protein
MAKIANRSQHIQYIAQQYGAQQNNKFSEKRGDFQDLRFP